MIVGYKKVALKELKPAPYNPRHIDKENFDGLCWSIRKYGIVQAFIVNTKTGNLVGGHQRLKAAQYLDAAYQGGDKENGRRIKTVDVLEVELSIDEEKALNLTLNSGKISGRFTDSVNEILGELQVTLGADYMNNLRLNDLRIDLSEWRSNLGSIDKVSDYDDKQIMDKITIDVPVHLKDEVRTFVREKIEEEEFEGVNVR